jgi:hypothetical protein
MKPEITQLRKQLLHGNGSEIMQLRCPVCSNSLALLFHSTPRKALNVHCMEDKCFSLNLDGLAETPPWVQDLGSKVTTG